MKQHDPYFPDVSSGILVHEIIPDSPAHKYVLDKMPIRVSFYSTINHSGRKC